METEGASRSRRGLWVGVWLAVAATAVGLLIVGLLRTRATPQVDDDVPPPADPLGDVPREYLGSDLNALAEDEAQSIRDAVGRRLDPGRPTDRLFEDVPRYVWEFDAGDGPPGYLLLRASRYVPSPFGTKVRLVQSGRHGPMATDLFGLGPSC